MCLLHITQNNEPGSFTVHLVVKLHRSISKPVLDFIIKDLTSVVILLIADQTLNDSRCCS